MDELFALDMENYFPGFGTVDFVNGYRYHSKSIGSGAVSGLASYKDASGVEYLIASGADNKVYNASTASSAATDITGAAVLGGPMLYFQSFNGYLFMSDGLASENLYRWAGSGNIAVSTFTVGGSNIDTVGPLAAYKSRFYTLLQSSPAIPKYTLVYYGDVNAVSGAMESFDFRSLLRDGGAGMFIGSVTRAKDFSEEELFCFISDKGEILVYSGDYPAATNWQIVGHYSIPRPLGPRAFFYIGANLCIITSQGVIAMSEIMGGSATGRYLGLSDAITPAFTAAATTTLFGNTAWCGVNYPRGNFAVCNIPVTSGSVSNQFYMNTTTQAWCKRTNQNAFCWAIHKDELYFGGLSGRVFKADNGYFDENPASEGNVLSRSTKLRPAFNYLNDRESQKRFIEARPILYESEGLNLVMGADVDFADNAPSSANAVTDSNDLSYKLYRPQVPLEGIGQALCCRFEQTVTTKRRSIQAIQVLYEPGEEIQPGVA